MAVGLLVGRGCVGAAGYLDPDGLDPGGDDMSKPAAPCRDCRRRAPGCHDAAVCSAWGQYQRDLVAWHDMYRADTIPQAEMDNYDKQRRAVARNRSNRRDR